MQAYQFDDRNITWRTFDYLDGQYHVQAVDTVDVLSKFQPNTPGKMHQHLMGYSTFVLRGEAWFWRPDGSLKEIRPTESYVHGAANSESHTEGACNQAVIAPYSIRGATGDMFAIFEEKSDEVHNLDFIDFQAALPDQVATEPASKIGSRAA